MEGWALSAESELRMERRTGRGALMGADAVPPTDQTPRAAKTNPAGRGGGEEEEGEGRTQI